MSTGSLDASSFFVGIKVGTKNAVGSTLEIIELGAIDNTFDGTMKGDLGLSVGFGFFVFFLAGFCVFVGLLVGFGSLLGLLVGLDFFGTFLVDLGFFLGLLVGFGFSCVGALVGFGFFVH